MKNLLLINCIFFTILHLWGCKKDKMTLREEPIAFETDAMDANIINGDRFVFIMKMKSKMPNAGIEITTMAKEEISGISIIQNGKLKSNFIQNVLDVKSLPNQKWVLSTIKVVSASDTSNFAIKSFRVIYK